jgi:hypothetical protein
MLRAVVGDSDGESEVGGMSEEDEGDGERVIGPAAFEFVRLDRRLCATDLVGEEVRDGLRLADADAEGEVVEKGCPLGTHSDDPTKPVRVRFPLAELGLERAGDLDLGLDCWAAGSRSCEGGLEGCAELGSSSVPCTWLMRGFWNIPPKFGAVGCSGVATTMASGNTDADKAGC